MKQFIFLLFAISAAVSHAQTPRELVPARGHYKQLGKISPKPAAPDLETDKLRFQTPQSTIDRRMELKPHYLKDVSANDFKLPDPPANSSEQVRAELNYLLSLQNQRSALDVDASLKMAGIYYNVRTKPGDSAYHIYRSNLFHIGRSVGTWFNPENMPVTADFAAKVWRDASYFIWSLKFKYARVRPNVLEKEIQNLEETDWAAYPSGHAANSYINAYIYQELAPEFTDIFIKDAYDMAHSREIIGVHYPSDSEASRIFARQFVNMLFKNSEFQNDLREVRKEWAEKASENFQKPEVKKRPAVTAASCGASASDCVK